MSRKYAFIDRDGTLIFEPPDTFQIDSIEKLRILDGAVEGLQLLLVNGYELVMVTNQNGVGTPSFPQETFDLPHNAMMQQFRAKGITFSEVFICPHFPEDNCACRKPKTGLVDVFMRSVQINKQKSFVCGDRQTDRQFADNLGIPFIAAITNKPFPIDAIRSFIIS